MSSDLIPQEVIEVARTLNQHKYQAYAVGGCVRDILAGIDPQDWDVTTDARPEDIQRLFPENVYENNFGTVAVKTGSENPVCAIVEVTTFRIESSYTDRRHPDEVIFATKIEEDLSRRDFTVNAMAINLEHFTSGNFTRADLREHIVDPYGGTQDLDQKIIRAVGEPRERFGEDALRLMRAVRFAVQLGFSIDAKTIAAIRSCADGLGRIAPERIRDEFAKMIMTPAASQAIITLEDLSLLIHIMPELREGIGCTQNKHHIYTVFEHNVRALGYTAGKEYSLIVRLASLLHDVGKPRSKKGEGPDSTFYNHDAIGAKMSVKILDRLHFPRAVVDHVAHLVRHHLFYYNVGEVTEAGVRRFLSRVGIEAIDDLMKVREADRIGSGVPKAVPYKLRHLQFMIDKVRHDPISAKMLKIKGDDIMKIAGIPPSPKVGYILQVLLEEVLTDPAKNDLGQLETRARDLGRIPDDDLKKMASAARGTANEFESGIEQEMKKKHHV